MLAVGLETHEVDDVHDPDGHVGEMAPEQVGGGQRLDGGDIAGAGQDHVGLTGLIGGRPLPDARPPGAVQYRLVDGQPRRRRLLAGHDHVDVVAAAQAVVRHRQEAVGVGRQVDPHHFGLLVHDVVDEAGVLMGEAVVVLAPHMGRQEIVEGGDRPAPLEVAGDLEPLGVLVEHRVDQVRERLVAAEQPVVGR
jgi:hypothetical protein